jgi:Tol biopolymer transport system component
VDLAWAPDSERIALSGGYGIDVLNTQTGSVETLVDFADDKVANQLAWSPDGEYLAYSDCRNLMNNQSCEIHVVSSDGKEQRRLTKNTFADEFPVWQPDHPNTD